MVHRCCVVGCARECYPGCGVTFHTFPNNAELRQKWIEAIPGRTTYKKSYTICSLHFNRDDFRTPTVAPFMLCKRKLKLSAIPSIFPMKNQNQQRTIVSDSDLDCHVTYPFPSEGMPYSHYEPKASNETNKLQARRPKYSWEKSDTVVINDDDTEEQSESPQPKKATCGECGGDASGPAWWCVSRGSQACADCARLDATGYWLQAPEGRPQGEVASLMEALKRELDLVTVKQEPKEEPEEPVAVVDCEPTPDPLDLKADDEEPKDEESRPEQVVPVIGARRLRPTVKVRLRVVKNRSIAIPRLIIQRPGRPIAITTIQPRPNTAIRPRPSTAIQPRPNTAIQPRSNTAIQPRPSTAIQTRPSTAIQPRPMVVGGGPGVTIQVPTLKTAQTPRPSRPLSSLPNPYVKLTRLRLPELLTALKKKAPPVTTVPPAPAPSQRKLIRIKVKDPTGDHRVWWKKTDLRK